MELLPSHAYVSSRLLCEVTRDRLTRLSGLHKVSVRPALGRARCRSYPRQRESTSSPPYDVRWNTDTKKDGFPSSPLPHLFCVSPLQWVLIAEAGDA